MPYDIKITEYPEGSTFKAEIQDLKELKEILERYKEKIIEVEFHKTKVYKRN